MVRGIVSSVPQAQVIWAGFKVSDSVTLPNTLCCRRLYPAEGAEKPAGFMEHLLGRREPLEAVSRCHYGNPINGISGVLQTREVRDLMKVCFYCTSTPALIKSNLHNGKLLHFQLSNFPFFSFSLSPSFLLLSFFFLNQVWLRFCWWWKLSKVT